MTSHAAENHQDYEEVKEERDLYKQKYLQFKKKYEYLVALYDHNLSDDEESIEPPAKKQRVYALMEGFGRLPFELIDKIFSNLKPKEILDSMLVSKCWKYFIESRYLSKVMDKVVVRFDSIEEYGVEELDVAATSSRNYKHVVAKFEHKVMQQFPFSAYASLIESLIIYCNSKLGLRKVEPVDFLKLKKLIVECHVDDDDYDFYDECEHDNLVRFIKASSFPEVTHLKMQFFDRSKISLAQLLKKFPKLKVLLLSSKTEFVVWHEMLKSYKSSKNQPKLEAISMDGFGKNFLLGFKNSLTEVCINDFVDSEYLITILKNLENLQSLTILAFDGSLDFAEPFPRHEKLQTLSIADGFDHEEFKEFLLHLPSLHTFIIQASATKELVEFLAINLKNFKKLICNADSSEETTKFYMGLKNERSDQYINTKFEIQFETSEETYSSILLEETFYNKHFK